MASESGRAEELRPLTSLRFFAAAAIVGLHATNYFPWAAPAVGLPLHQGVSFFFVLSGFILTHAYSGRKVGYGRFVGARLARLWPAHLVTALMVLFLIRADSQAFPGTGFFDRWVILGVNLTLMHALVPFQAYVFSWNSVSWSISTELFFYLAFPLLLVNLNRTWPWKLAGAAGLILLYVPLVAAAGIPETGRWDELNVGFLVYASPLCRIFEFVLGMSAYVAWRRLGQLRLGVVLGTALELLALGGLLWWYRGGSLPLAVWLDGSPVTRAWFGMAGGCLPVALLILAFAGGEGVFGRVLSLRPFVWLGEVSFALYMVHQVTMKWLYIGQLEGRWDPASPAVALGLCLGLAALLHHVVERPAQRGLLRLMDRRAGRRGPVAAVVPP